MLKKLKEKIMKNNKKKHMGICPFCKEVVNVIPTKRIVGMDSTSIKYRVECKKCNTKGQAKIIWENRRG